MKTKSKMKLTYKEEIQLNPYSNAWAYCWEAEADGSDNGYKLEEPILHSLPNGTIYLLLFSDS